MKIREGIVVPPRRKARYLLAVVSAVLLTLVSSVVGATPAAASHRTAPNIYECARFHPTLYPGVQNQAACVAAVQGLLRHTNQTESIVIDGIFGQQTTNHLSWYKTVRGIELFDGGPMIVGVFTWADFVLWCDQYGVLPCYQHRAY